MVLSIHIALCDDEASELSYLMRLVSNWAQRSKRPVTLSSFESSEAFLFAFEEDKSIDILLLDIQMKAMDGISLAKQLRAGGGAMQIIFITGYSDFIGEGYEVEALHYLIKPVGEEKLFQVLDRACERLSGRESALLIETENGQARILTQDILYAEAFAHTTIIQTARARFEAKLSIGKLEELLGGEFLRCHRSYLVGLRYITRITKTDIVMDDGKAVPLSRRLYSAANKAFIRFYREGMP